MYSREVTIQPEGIGGVVFVGEAHKNHTLAHPYAGKLNSYVGKIYIYQTSVRRLNGICEIR